MHPIIFLVPALGLIFGPRLWVSYVLNKHNRVDEEVPATAGGLARELLDQHGLQSVRVESTDIGDHYDPRARAVRIARDKLDRKTLTALTTASHEVAHAIQHASDYGPFLWRTRLVKIAQVTGEAGSVLLLAIPAAALLGRSLVPPTLIGAAAIAMLGTGVVAQLAALPSELDASFGRALPMLRAGRIDASRYDDAHQILLACSLTYVASSLVAILHFWPWIGRPIVTPVPVALHPVSAAPAGISPARLRRSVPPEHPRPSVLLTRAIPARRPTSEAPMRRFAKGLIRGWFRLTGSH
jgi:Zn-dependent membrane protease YugP